MSVETSQRPTAHPGAPEAAQEVPALRERPRRRRRGFRVATGPFLGVLGVAFLLLLTGGVALGVLGIYQGQVGTVGALESLAQARTAHPADRPPVGGSGSAVQVSDEPLKAFRADPVFKSQAWEAQLAASRDVRRAVHEEDLAFASRAAAEVWWPGLPERVKAAAALLEPFDPVAGDSAEVAGVTAAALRVCESSDPAKFAARQPRGSEMSLSNYEAAAAAVYPALAAAAKAHVCPSGVWASIPLPVDKNQMPE